MRGTIKRAFLHVSRALGLFRLARYVTRRGVRILAYHGFAVVGDQNRFRPTLFIRPETFEGRLRWLAARRYPVVSLDAALAGLETGGLPDCATVITFDDGFASVREHAAPALRRFGFVATLYVTSYHCAKETPVFRLVVQYMFWRTTRRRLELASLYPAGEADVLLDDPAARDRAMWRLIGYGETACDEEGRLSLARRLGERLGVEFEGLRRARALSLLTLPELRAAGAAGIDVQLHTHRHRLPAGEAEVRREIGENRRVLQAVARRPLRHLAYPSGIWSPAIWPWLATEGIASAVTSDPGLNFPGTPPLALFRILDGERVSQIEFEAKLSGYSELLRRGRALCRGRRPSRRNGHGRG